jgi:hypothetical protein
MFSLKETLPKKNIFIFIKMKTKINENKKYMDLKYK